MARNDPRLNFVFVGFFYNRSLLLLVLLLFVFFVIVTTAGCTIASAEANQCRKSKLCSSRAPVLPTRGSPSGARRCGMTSSPQTGPPNIPGVVLSAISEIR